MIVGDRPGHAAGGAQGHAACGEGDGGHRDVIADPALLERAKADHQAQVGRTPYLCPLPVDLQPPVTMSA